MNKFIYLDDKHKLNFIPSQMYGVIRVSLLPVQDVRTAMIRVLCDMIYNINKHKDNLSIFENEFVSVMDRFANEPSVNKNFKEYLINAYVIRLKKRKKNKMNNCLFIELMIFVKLKNLQKMVQN
jgi:hypothetical protein